MTNQTAETLGRAKLDRAYKSPAQDVTAIIRLAGDGTIKTIDKRCCEILGYGSNEPEGWPIARLIPAELQPRDGKRTIAQILESEDTGYSEVESIARREDGSTVKLRLTLMASRSEGKRQFVGLVRRVSEGVEPTRLVLSSDLEASAPTAEAKPSPGPAPAPGVPGSSPFGGGVGRPVPASFQDTALVGSVVHHHSINTVPSAPVPSELTGRPAGDEAAPEVKNGEEAATQPVPGENAEESELEKLFQEAETLYQKLATEAEQANAIRAAEAMPSAPSDAPESLQTSEGLVQADPVKDGPTDQEEPPQSEPAAPAPIKISEVVHEQLPTPELSEKPNQAVGATEAQRQPELKADREAIPPVERSNSDRKPEVREEASRPLGLDDRNRDLEEANPELVRQSQAAAKRHKLWQQSIESLQAELEQARVQREKEVQEQTERESQLKEKCAALELEAQNLGDALSQGQAQLKEEKAQRDHLEQKIEELAGLRAALQQELAEAKRSKEQFQRESKENEEKLRSRSELLAIEQRKLEAKVKEWQTAEAALADLAAANVTVRGELDAAIEAGRIHRRRIEELEAAHQTVTTRLAEARTQMKVEVSQRQRLETRVRELEHAKAELARQSEAATSRNKLWQESIQSLQGELEQARAQREKEVQEQARREGELKSQAATLAAHSRSLEESLAQAQSQLKDETTRRTLAEHKADQLAGARASLEEQLGESRRAQDRLRREAAEKEGQLRSRADTLAKEQRQLEAKVEELQAVLNQKNQEREREVAALRYAILEGLRVHSNMGEQGSARLRESINRLSQITSALLNTPLSKTQRHLVNNLRQSLETWSSETFEAPLSEGPNIEAFQSQSLPFNAEELTHNVFQAIRSAAAEAGIETATTLSDHLSATIYGDSAHLYQLSTLLATSIIKSEAAQRLELNVSLEAGATDAAEATLRFLVMTKGSAKELSRRWTEVAASSRSLDLEDLSEPESGVAVSWQLARALGGTADFNVTGEKEVLLKLVLPLRTSEAQ